MYLLYMHIRACIYIYIYTCVCQCIYASVKIYKLVSIVNGHLKAPFSTGTTLRCWEARYSFLWIAPLYLWSVPLIMLSVKQGNNNLGMTWPGIEPRTSRPLPNTLPTWPISIYIYIYIYIVYIYIYRYVVYVQITFSNLSITVKVLKLLVIFY